MNHPEDVLSYLHHSCLLLSATSSPFPIYSASSLTIMLMIPLDLSSLAALSLINSLFSSDLLVGATSFLTKFFQMTPFYQLFYLVHQLVTIISVMAICSIELTILVQILSIGVTPRGLRLLN